MARGPLWSLLIINKYSVVRLGSLEDRKFLLDKSRAKLKNRPSKDNRPSMAYQSPTSGFLVQKVKRQDLD